MRYRRHYQLKCLVMQILSKLAPNESALTMMMSAKLFSVLLLYIVPTTLPERLKKWSNHLLESIQSRALAALLTLVPLAHVDFVRSRGIESLVSVVAASTCPIVVVVIMVTDDAISRLSVNIVHSAVKVLLVASPYYRADLGRMGIIPAMLNILRVNTLPLILRRDAASVLSIVCSGEAEANKNDLLKVLCSIFKFLKN